MYDQSFLFLPSVPLRGSCHSASSLSSDVLLQRQPPLRLDQLQSLISFFIHHFEKSILQDGVQLISSHFELN